MQTPMPMTASSTLLDQQELQALEQKFDPEMRFRPSVPPATLLIKYLLIGLSCFHYYTAGFGLLREVTHRGVHLAFVLGLIFLVFAGTQRRAQSLAVHSLGSPGGIPLIDWLLGLCCAISVLYIPSTFDDLAFRVGNPNQWDVLMGTVLFVALLDATRRSMGWPLPLIALGFTAYALFGRVFPGLLQHAGIDRVRAVHPHRILQTLVMIVHRARFLVSERNPTKGRQVRRKDAQQHTNRETPT